MVWLEAWRTCDATLTEPVVDLNLEELDELNQLSDTEEEHDEMNHLSGDIGMMDQAGREEIQPNSFAVSYTHLTLPTNREV